MTEAKKLPDYRILGSGDVSLFMFHGAYGDGRYFDNTSEYLAEQGYRVVVWNAPGYAKDDPKADFTVESAADAAVDLVNAVGTATNVIIGHSMGALIASNAVVKLGDNVKGLVLSGASVGFDQRTPEEQAVFVAERLAPITEQGLTVAEYSPALLKTMMAPGASGQYVDYVKNVVADMRTDTFVQAMTAIVTYTDNVPTVKQIKVPTLLLAGEFDTACPPVGMQKLNELIAGSEYHLIKDVGHYAFAENPAKFHELLIQFLTRHFPVVSK